MTSQYDPILRSVAEETLSSLAFLFPIEEEESCGTSDEPMIAVGVTFSGPRRGALMMSVSASMLAPLATNMLGIEPPGEPTCDQQQDALKEMLNVVCGNLLPLIGTDRDVFNVHSPRILSEGAAVELSGHALKGEAGLALDAGRATLKLFFEEPVHAASQGIAGKI